MVEILITLQSHTTTNILTLIDIIDIIEQGGVYMEKEVKGYDEYFPASVYEREHQELDTVIIFDELCKALGVNSKNNKYKFYDENFEIIGKSFYTDALKQHKENHEPIFNDHTTDRLEYIISLMLDIETRRRKKQYQLFTGESTIKIVNESPHIISKRELPSYKIYEITRQVLYDLVTGIAKATNNVGGIIMLNHLLEDIIDKEAEESELDYLFRTSYEYTDAIRFFLFIFIRKMLELCKGENQIKRNKIRDTYLSILTRNYYYDIYTVLIDYMKANKLNYDNILPIDLGKKKITDYYYHPEDKPRNHKTVFLKSINYTKYADISESFFQQPIEDLEDDFDSDDFMGIEQIVKKTRTAKAAHKRRKKKFHAR